MFSHTTHTLKDTTQTQQHFAGIQALHILTDKQLGLILFYAKV